MKIYRYPTRALTGDYVRSAAGIIVGFGVLLSGPATPAIIVIGGGVAGLFSLFGFRTVQRHATKVAVTDGEICDRAFGSKVMRWGDLERLKLRYYGTRKQDRRGSEITGGFMQLTLSGAGRSFTFESSMEGFTYIAWRATKAARENGISLDPASAGNLLAIGLDADRETAPPEV